MFLAEFIALAVLVGFSLGIGENIATLKKLPPFYQFWSGIM
jgi:MFS superfamily sulfate permease-like transporter